MQNVDRWARMTTAQRDMRRAIMPAATNFAFFLTAVTGVASIAGLGTVAIIAGAILAALAVAMLAAIQILNLDGQRNEAIVGDAPCTHVAALGNDAIVERVIAPDPPVDRFIRA